VDVGPFQTIFHRDITSRPIRIPKFPGSLGFDKHCDKLKPRSHDPICKLGNGAKGARKFRSITKSGVTCGPDAVLLDDCPVDTSLRCFARVISIEVLLAPVSKWAIATIEESTTLFGGFWNTVAVEISRGIFMPIEISTG
jgi:hypothetical protein